MESLLYRGLSEFRSKLGQQKDKRQSLEAGFGVGYPTCFLSFDFLNGVVVTVENEEKNLNFTYNSIGIRDGSMVAFVGRSGSGKTTFAVQASANIVRPFPESFILHEDIENGIADTRLEQLLNLGDDLENKYIRRNQGISTETFHKRVKLLHDEKLNNPDIYNYDTGLLDSKGEKIYKLQPSVVLLDSWALLSPDDNNESDELGGNMSVTSATRLNTQMIKKVFKYLRDANIILFIINHIMPDVSLIPKKSQIAWLKQGERLPGGEAIIYLFDNIFRFNDGGKLDKDKEFGISGIKVEIEFIKSRSGAPGRSTTFILDYAVGFDNELSLYMLLKQHDKIKGSGIGMYLEGLDTVKFRQKTIKQKLRESPEFLEHFSKLCLEILQEEIIDQSAHLSKKKEDSFDMSQHILGMIGQPAQLSA